jgi:alkane 1-monooxygenase
MTVEITRMVRSFRNWKYFFNLTPVFLVIYGNLSGGMLTLLNFIFSFAVLGIAEILLPEDRTNDDVVEDELPDILLFLSVMG